MVTRLFFGDVDAELVPSLLVLVKVAWTPKDLKYATTAEFLALPRDFTSPRARVAAREILIAVRPWSESARSRITSF